MAWPKVWPKLSSARRPASCSSAATMFALTLAASRSSSGVTRGSRLRSAGRSCTSRVARGRSATSACLTTSAQPARTSDRNMVLSRRQSLTTSLGGWKAPTRFLPSGWFTPVLPPSALSTCATTVVGRWTSGRPRSSVAATNPARSPTTPPPRAKTGVSRVTPTPSAQSSASRYVSSDFDASPAATTRGSGCQPPASIAARTSSRYRSATCVSVMTSARPGSRPARAASAGASARGSKRTAYAEPLAVGMRRGRRSGTP